MASQNSRARRIEMGGSSMGDASRNFVVVVWRTVFYAQTPHSESIKSFSVGMSIIFGKTYASGGSNEFSSVVFLLDSQHDSDTTAMRIRLFVSTLEKRGWTISPPDLAVKTPGDGACLLVDPLADYLASPDPESDRDRELKNAARGHQGPLLYATLDSC